MSVMFNLMQVGCTLLVTVMPPPEEPPLPPPEADSELFPVSTTGEKFPIGIISKSNTIDMPHQSTSPITIA